MRVDLEPSLEERAANWLADLAIATVAKAERDACAAIADDAAAFLSDRGEHALAVVAKGIAEQIRKRAK
jgi:hypothetical protein